MSGGTSLLSTVTPNAGIKAAPFLPASSSFLFSLLLSMNCSAFQSREEMAKKLMLSRLESRTTKDPLFSLTQNICWKQRLPLFRLLRYHHSFLSPPIFSYLIAGNSRQSQCCCPEEEESCPAPLLLACESATKSAQRRTRRQDNYLSSSLAFAIRGQMTVSLFSLISASCPYPSLSFRCERDGYKERLCVEKSRNDIHTDQNNE